LYLKKLRLAGFKSFADPVSLEFSEGISAIVGPNGSGKSNITDAIKWVLGEQSIKSLRGKKMEDVIFSGTEKKEASGYAEVVLILDNKDGSLENYPEEVAISRKLYRTGESDYAINKKGCKLKDIHGLFMDTGLGKSGYSLISQGSIENILASSPIELRNIFEEAVGIVSYKTKKNEAEKKLETTQSHLDRLWDIMTEIEKQLGPLKNQARKAKSWMELHDELKTVDLVMFHHKMGDATVQLKALKNDLNKKLMQCQEIESVIEEKDQFYQKLTIENRELDSLADTERKKLAELKSDYDRLQREDIRYKSQLEANGITQERLKHEKDDAILRCKESQDRVAKLESEKNSLILALEKQLGISKKIDHDLGLIRAEEHKEKERIKAVQEAKLNHQIKCQLLEQKRLEIITDIQGSKTEFSFIEKRLQEMIKNHNELSKAIENQKQIIVHLLDERKQRETGFRELQKLYNTGLNEQKKRQSMVHLLSNNLKVNASKVEYLKNIQKNYQDYFPTIRKLMTSRQALGSAIDDVYGPVGELISTESKYIQAIDIALGAKSQNIVVASVKIANDCINLLKRERLGRATFLPLDNLKFSAVDQRSRELLATIPGAEGIASELVKSDKKFLTVVDSLLGRIIVAQNFDSGRLIQQKLDSKYTVVTLEGEIFYPGGAIVGGQSKDQKQSPLSKKVEIENLEREINSLQSEFDKNQNEEESCHQFLNRQLEKINTFENQLIICKQTLWENENILKNFEQKYAESDKIIFDMKAKIEVLKEKISQHDEALSVTEAEYQQAKELTMEPDADENSEMIRNQLDKLVLKGSQIQMDITQIKGEISGLDQQILLINEQIAHQLQRNNELEEEIKNYESDSKTGAQMLEDLTEKHNNLSKSIETLQSKNRVAQELQKKNTQRLESLQEEIKTQNHNLIMSNDEKNKLSTQVDGLQLQMNHWEENMFQTYEMNAIMVEDAFQRLKESKKLEELDLSEDRQRKLKEKISALGNVNFNAVEEYEEIQVRHGFMKEQMDDLNAGKRELLDIINTLYDAMTEQFKTNFIKLQENFTRIFSILFEGGRAYLEFTDPTGILEGGIELVAQPPGKRLRHISLLSGGEKSMVAIALLFSFLEINPSPFCVIDEVDAALDDHNIYRYINYLRKVSENNQFITITHRRKTLEVCDNLYGVSMSKDGVSQLVSVRLSDYA
jgi:chromosome segregation protein